MGKLSLLGKVHTVYSLSHSCLNFSSLCLIPFLIPLLPSTSRDINQALYSRLRLGLRRWEQATLIISPLAFLFSWLAMVILSADRTSFTPLACPLQVVCPLTLLWYAYSQPLIPQKKIEFNLFIGVEFTSATSSITVGYPTWLDFPYVNMPLLLL